MATNRYSIAQLVNLPNVPGIYAWYFVFDPQINHVDYHKVFKNKRINIGIKGNLQEIYKGSLECFPHTFSNHPISDLSALAECTDFFSPPIYIGIAKKSLADRLPQHVDKLTRLLYPKHPKAQAQAAAAQAATTVVTDDDDSSIFAQRIHSAISGIKNVGLTSFVVKTVEMTPNYPEVEIRALEYFLNRTYVPIYGRR